MRRAIIFILILFFLSLSARRNRAEGDSQKGLPLRDKLHSRITLRQLIALAYKSNPGLQAARRRWEAVIEKYPRVTAYPDPIFSYYRFIEEIETKAGPQRQKFSLVQRIPFPGKLSLRGDIVATEVRIARTEFEQETRDLIAELKDAYYELFYIYKAIEITRQNKELAEHLSKLGTTDYSMDGTTLNDVFKAQSQLAQLSYDLILLTELKETEITRINSLLNRPPEAPLGKPEEIVYHPFKYSREELYQLALENQQELQIAELQIKKRKEKLKLARMEYLPNFSLGVNYTEVGRSLSSPMGVENGKDAYGAMLGINIPLWLAKNRSRVQEAQKRYEAMVFKKKERENRTFAALKRIYFKLRNSERLIRLYRDSLIPQAEQSMETAETWYKEKKGSFSGLLETQSVWLNFNLAFQRAIADYYQRIARMEKVVGVVLGRKE